jgi:hypothetical protein
VQHALRALIVVAAVAAANTIASAQSATDAPAMPAETAPPRAPMFPTPPKPDFSSMRFLLGTWNCVSRSERRGNEVSRLTSTYTLAPDGYFMKQVTKSSKVSYSAFNPTTTDWVTYDSNAKRWIDVEVGSYGSYGYSTSTGWEHGHILWSDDSFLPDGDVTSSTGTLINKISDTKFIGLSAFTTTAGLLNRVTTSCAKS